MADGTTKISDIIVPELFTSYIQQYTEEKSAIIQSGAATRSAFLDNFLAGGGITINVPGFKDLDNDEENISNDTGSSSTPHKIGTESEIAVRLSRNNSWSASDLSAALAGTDPMGAIQMRVGAYWTRRLQAVFIAVVKGIYNLEANDTGDMTHDISGDNYTRGLTDFSAEAFVDAAATMGDSMDDLAMVCVHSLVYARMKKNNMIDFLPDSVQRVNIPTFLGHRVVVDDGMPVSNGKYDTWLFGPNAIQLGMGSPKVPVEVDRKPEHFSGSGEEILYNRVEWCIHPNGYKYNSSASQGGPSNTALSGSSSWERIFDRKMIKMARLQTRER